MVAGVEIPINRNASAIQMAETIFGDSSTIVSASYTGDRDSSGIYTNGDTIAPGVVPGDTGVMLSTGDLRGFTNNNASQSNLNSGTTTSSSGPNGVSEFNAAAGTSTYDASYMGIVFVPDGDVLTMQFVFTSEEYPEYTNSNFQDFFGVWVNGSLVDLAVGDGDVDPGNLNSNANGNLFQDNTSDQLNTEMDGVTLTLTLKMNVNAGVQNTIRIGIADVSDSSYDSTVLIAADSVQTALVANDDALNMGGQTTKTFDVLSNDTNTTGGTLTIDQINGLDVAVGDTVTLQSGQQVTLNADGTLTVLRDGDDEVVNLTYRARSSAGETDVGIITLNSIPCFVAGTHILTDQGEKLIEHLAIGDMVVTKDQGPQPLRWIGSRTVEASGDFAPIYIAPNTFGSHRELWLSPLHRVLIRDCLAELLFAESEVLVAARDLINGNSVRQVEGGDVTYFHILFDRHQVVVSEGLETESFLPGPQIMDSFEAQMVAEIHALFPEIAPDTCEGYGQAARLLLKRYEAQVLQQARAA